MFTNFFIIFLLSLAIANPRPDSSKANEITVEAHRNIEIFVAQPKITNLDPSVESYVGSKAFVQYTSAHWHNAQIKNLRGTYQPVTMMVERLYVYDEETIEIAWDNCNYKRSPLECSVKNDHYLLQPYIEIDENQIVVRLILYDSEMQIIGSSTHSDNKIIKWIRQQEITVAQKQSFSASTTITHKPKEDLPLKWEIPQALFNSHIHQASLKLWVGLRF
jgi:hypothetical protein